MWLKCCIRCKISNILYVIKKSFQDLLIGDSDQPGQYYVMNQKFCSSIYDRLKRRSYLTIKRVYFITGHNSW